MLRSRRGPHSSSTAKLGVDRDGLLTVGLPGPHLEPAQLLGSLGPHWSFSGSRKGKHPPTLPSYLSTQHKN